jgi:hypothetical protein
MRQSEDYNVKMTSHYVIASVFRLVQRAKFKHYPVDLTFDVAAIAWGEENDEE